MNNKLKDISTIDILTELVHRFNLTPRTGFGKGKIEFEFQKGKLVFTNDLLSENGVTKETKTLINIEV